MDPLLELARHPDIIEALGRVDRGDEAKAARELLAMKRLATEHPNAWVTEVVHEFYATPALARSTWVNLRYCRQFVRDLAKRSLREHSRRRFRMPFGRTAHLPIPEDIARQHQREGDRKAAEMRWADELHRSPAIVDTLCEKLGELPAVPTFIQDTIGNTDGLTGQRRDAQVRTLLEHPEQLRRDVPDYSAARSANGAERERRPPLPFSFVQEGELQQIGKIRTMRGELRRDPCGTPDQPASFSRHPARRAFDMDLCGLAFSGGGIRSATFNLGVLQTLAQSGLLRRFDYLSTVSGGGYIGSWLAAWIHREVQEPYDHNNGGDALAAIERRLSPTRSPNPMDESVRPIRFLREYSNYLTPRAGFFSADTWTMLGIYVRNSLLNQVTIVGLLVAVLLVPRGLHAIFSRSGEAPWALFLAATFWLIGIVVLLLNLRRLDPPNRPDAPDAPSIVEDDETSTPAATRKPRWYARPIVIHLLVVLPWLFAAALALPWLHCQGAVRAAATVAAIVGSSLLIALLSGRVDRCWSADSTARWPRANAFAAITGSAVAAGLAAGGLTWVVFRLIAMIWLEPDALPWHLASLGTPALLSMISLTIVVMLGMLGAHFPDEHREWWSRFRTTLHLYALSWLTLSLVALYVPWAIHQAGGLYKMGTGYSLGALAAWIGSTVFGLMRGPAAEAEQKEQNESTAPPPLSSTLVHYAALIAPYLFAIGLVLGVSESIHLVVSHTQSECADVFRQSDQWLHLFWSCAAAESYRAWIWAGVAFLIAALFSWRVNINEFSIHHFYKNRLVRCYLGASHGRNRKPDWFTGFDPRDDIRLTCFDVNKSSSPYPGPYPILNCALNLVGGRDLAWQERRATSFVFTPKYCGYDVDRAVLSKDPSVGSEGFVPTSEFYRDGGPSIGTAMAISGAAANPNMGRSSSPALTFLMTVFNVRLGWWIGNPRRKTSNLPGPRIGLIYTIFELFGATDDSRGFVNLSDGGHFDNLGVYELIRRCCRYIVVCDAGQDGRFVFEDLGDLIRRCRTDFGVEIEIAVDRIRERDELGRSQTHCVVGKIHYLNLPRRKDGHLVDADDKPLERDPATGALRPGQTPAHEIGYLVYLKPTMTGDEPQDVLEYFRRIPEFPHQTTADQWFNESQFESYRKLGMHIGHVTFARYLEDRRGATADLKDLFKRLHEYWYPPSPVINERATEHAQEYSQIMDTLRTGSALQGLDHVVFSRLPVSEGTQISKRDEFYVCNRMIQLMENVYADLDLENNWNHPHVKGWKGVFEAWAQTPAFQRTWCVSESTYAERFRNFYNERLNGKCTRGGTASADVPPKTTATESRGE